MANFLTCDGGLDSAGDLKSCLEAFAPVFTMSLPDSVGLPQIDELVIPDFSGIDPEAMMKSLEFIGLDACALVNAIVGPLASVAGGMIGQLQATINGIADMPQDIVDGLQTTAQGSIDGLFGPMDTLMGAFDSDACTTLAGAANQGMEKAISAEATAIANDFSAEITSIDAVITDVNIGNAALDTRLTAIGG